MELEICINLWKKNLYRVVWTYSECKSYVGSELHLFPFPSVFDVQRSYFKGFRMITGSEKPDGLCLQRNLASMSELCHSHWWAADINYCHRKGTCHCCAESSLCSWQRITHRSFAVTAPLWNCSLCVQNNPITFHAPNVCFISFSFHPLHYLCNKIQTRVYFWVVKSRRCETKYEIHFTFYFLVTYLNVQFSDSVFKYGSEYYSHSSSNVCFTHIHKFIYILHKLIFPVAKADICDLQEFSDTNIIYSLKQDAVISYILSIFLNRWLIFLVSFSV